MYCWLSGSSDGDAPGHRDSGIGIGIGIGIGFGFGFGFDLDGNWRLAANPVAA